MTKLSEGSVGWAFDVVATNSDSDLFPPTPEFDLIKSRRRALIDALTGPEIQQLTLGVSRRFIVPKDKVSYRQATQLDPQDGLILTAIVHQFGQGIEDRRLPDSQVFSYRFAPSVGGLYVEPSGWNDFWSKAALAGKKSQVVVYCDISDFYNQIYHHTLENQLVESGFPNQAMKWVLSLIESTTAGVSRGVPIGPHPVHLLAEATLIPIDNALVDSGLRFLRYADDILIFTESEAAAQKALATVAHTLDRQQRLALQRHKTRLFEPAEFQAFARGMIEDQPISTQEADLIAIIRKYSGGNPYRTVWFSEIALDDWLKISEATLSAILSSYLSAQTVNYTRLSWFYRRLAQIGHPGALKATLASLDRLAPCFPSVIGYLASIQSIDNETWRTVGGQLAKMLDHEFFRDEEYYQVMLLSLFARNRDMNHFSKVAQRYATATPAARRQILLAAKQNGAVDWLRNLKEDFPAMDSGQRMAFLYGASGFPPDERNYFVQRHEATFVRPLEVLIARAARRGAPPAPGT